MRLYAETSAVVAWLLEEKAAPPIEGALSAADMVLASTLTLIESERVLVRGTALGQITHQQAIASRRRLRRAAEYWLKVRPRGAILDRAALPFPVEPVRTLDALHLASVLEVRAAVPGLAVLSLDGRVRVNAEALGLEVLPASDG